MDVVGTPDKGLENMGHAETFGLGQIVQVRPGEGGGVYLPAQNSQALAALQGSAPFHPADKALRALLLHSHQQGAVVQRDAVPRLGGLQSRWRDGDAAGAKHGLAPGLQRDGGGEGPHPQLRAL